MRFASFALALALLTFSASAQDKNNAPAQSSTTVLINGQPIKGKVLEIDGKHFVAVEDLAQNLRGTIAYGDGQIALTLSQLPPVTAQPPSSQLPPATPRPPSSQLPSVTPQPQSAELPRVTPPAPSSQLPPVTPPPPSSQPPLVTAPPATTQVPPMSAPPSETGGVKGTLTYFFNFQIGNKPDNGSKVWLAKGQVEIPTSQTFVGTSTALGTTGNPEQYTAIQYSVADANGNFELHDVPPGEYTLIVQSAHTVGTLKEKRNFFGRGNGRTPRDSKGRVEFLKVLIKPGETVDASKDFGPNIDM